MFSRQVISHLCDMYDWKAIDYVKTYLTSDRLMLKLIDEEYMQRRKSLLGKCNYFPCEKLNCNKDCLNNGYPYRWS